MLQLQANFYGFDRPCRRFYTSAIIQNDSEIREGESWRKVGTAAKAESGYFQYHQGFHLQSRITAQMDSTIKTTSPLTTCYITVFWICLWQRAGRFFSLCLKMLLLFPKLQNNVIVHRRKKRFPATDVERNHPAARTNGNDSAGIIKFHAEGSSQKWTSQETLLKLLNPTPACCGRIQCL